MPKISTNQKGGFFFHFRHKIMYQYYVPFESASFTEFRAGLGGNKGYLVFEKFWVKYPKFSKIVLP